ncbi:MAG TPA: RsmB/NOP family class I SAM-dependent RNA methyltransferase [Burkholderiaceae bacterium]|nr:RsmB/NOP family class I SAM-dependent RNA methyltransferase [Burkholderiaceae bacterium]
MDRVRISPVVVDSLSHLLARLLRFEGPADATMSRHFKADRRLGPQERSLVAEAAFDALRRLATLRWIMQTADPMRAPHLAALIELGRRHGIDSLGPRLLRGDERAVRGALSIDLAHAPAAVRAEVPMWLFQRITVQYHDAQQLLEALTQAAPLDLRVNTIKTDRDAVLAEFRATLKSTPSSNARGQPVPEAVPTRYSPDGIRLRDKPALTRWPMYKDGRIEVQDEGSQLVARLTAPRRGSMVVDFCAGAGGKTLAIGSQMKSTGRIYALDVNAKRLAGLGPRLARSGLSNVQPVAIRSAGDVRVKRLAGKIDRVVVDAPCSGSGTLRRNPDLKWRFDESELERLTAVQSDVLRASARLVKRGGRIVYATCSVLSVENQDIVSNFLTEHPEFSLMSAADVLQGQGIAIDDAQRFAPWLVMLPHIHETDGFFAAVLEKTT